MAQRRAVSDPDLPMRVVSSVVLIALVLSLSFLGGWWFLQLVCVLSILCLDEWLNMVSRPALSRLLRVLIAVVPAVFLSVFLVNDASVGQMALFIAAAVGVIALLVFLVQGRDGAPNILWAWAGLAYVLAFGSALLLLRRNGQVGSDSGLFTLIFIFLVVWATDIGAYFVGRSIGGAKLAPRISPGKTWSGFFGGITVALIFGLGWVAFVDSSLGFAWPWAVVIVALSISGQVGDLFESALKRNRGVKDSGRLIPGHGGILDRVDGLVFAAILAAIVQVSNVACGPQGFSKTLLCQ